MVKDEGGLLSWTKKILIPNLYYTDAYNGNKMTSYDEKFLTNTYAYRLGPPRLRQIRVKSGEKLFIEWAVWGM